jgi:hypothetical protein
MINVEAKMMKEAARNKYSDLLYSLKTDVTFFTEES